MNWAGFYIRDDKFPSLATPISSTPGATVTTTISTTYASHHRSLLLLGPFHGKPACQTILFGRGVCGAAAEKKETIVVPDVLNFPGHITCDADSRSEIVVPILVRGEVCLTLSRNGPEKQYYKDPQTHTYTSLYTDRCDHRHRLHRALHF